MKLKFNRADRSILLLSLAIVIVFSYFLYDDSFLFHSRESKNAKIGSIRKAENDVRLRASDSFTWNPAKKAEIVFERDSVFTGKLSQTQIDLIDGSKIYLSENSLVTLIAKNGNLELNLRYGNIKTELNPTSKLELKAGSQKILLNKESDSSTLEIRKPKFGLTKIKLLSGNLSVKHSAGSESETLVRDQTIIIKPTGTIQKSKTGTIELLTADKSQFYLGSEEKGFNLDWHSQNTEKNTLTISKDIEFKSIVLTEPNIKTKVFIKELPMGSYFWKISGTDANSSPIESRVHTFSMSRLEKLSIVDPFENKKWTVETKENIAQFQVPVTISWTNLYDTVQTQVSKSVDFKDSVYDKELTKTYSIENGFTSGVYFVRARGKKANQFTEWSDTRTFEVAVIPKGLVKPETPVLLTKKLIFSSVVGRSPSSINPVTVKWQGAISAVKYEVELSLKDQKFAKPMRYVAKGTRLDYVPKNIGLHYYRVRAISSDNVPGDYSEVGELQTKLTAPRLFKIENVLRKSNDPDSVAPTAQIKLSWSPVHLASKYLIEVSDDAEFSKPETVDATSNFTNYDATKTGKYFFRVIASDSSQSVKSEPSNTENSQYSYVKRLGKPILTEPKNKMTVFLQKEIEPFIWLNWDSTVNQKKFELEIALDKNFSKIIKRQTLNENRFLIKDKLPLGKIYWRVRQLADNPDLISDWTETREFQLIHNKNEGVFK